METLADLTPQERAECVGMWCNYQTPCGTERAIYSPTRFSKVETLFEPGYGHFDIEDLSRVTPRFDLPRAWNPDGTPVKGQWVEGEYLGASHGLSHCYYLDSGQPTHRYFETAWEPLPEED